MVLNDGRVKLMDGAMGSELLRRGLPPGSACEAWNLTHPETIRSIHADYVTAGARCLLTNTFQANPLALARHGLDDQLEDIGRIALELARSAVGPEGLVVADIGPIMSAVDREFDDLDALRRTVRALCGADAILLETCSTPHALDAAAHITIWPESVHLPVILSLTYMCHSDGTIASRSGHPPEWFAQRAARHGVSVLGVNCGRDVTMHHITAIVNRYRESTDLPLLVRPNAGSPHRVANEWSYPTTDSQFASAALSWVRAGATLIGGCCGTTADHIAALRDLLIDNRDLPRP
jgi:methionine synthase I (cobalamin-dependent)